MSSAVCHILAELPHVYPHRSTRDRVLDAIVAEPGSTPADLVTDTGLSGVVIDVALRELARDGAIVPCGRGGWRMA